METIIVLFCIAVTLPYFHKCGIDLHYRSLGCVTLTTTILQILLRFCLFLQAYFGLVFQRTYWICQFTPVSSVYYSDCHFSIKLSKSYLKMSMLFYFVLSGF